MIDFSLYPQFYKDIFLPLYLRKSIEDTYNEVMRYFPKTSPRIDLYADELISSINVAETGGEITSNKAWELRKKLLDMERE